MNLRKPSSTLVLAIVLAAVSGAFALHLVRDRNVTRSLALEQGTACHPLPADESGALPLVLHLDAAAAAHTAFEVSVVPPREKGRVEFTMTAPNLRAVTGGPRPFGELCTIAGRGLGPVANYQITSDTPVKVRVMNVNRPSAMQEALVAPGERRRVSVVEASRVVSLSARDGDG